MRFPARTIRVRLTLGYGIVFLLTGAVLITLGYLEVRHNLDARPEVIHRLHLHLIPRHPNGYPPNVLSHSLYMAIYRQFVASALHRLLLEYIGALVLMTAFSVAAGWLLAGRALKPLRAITATAQRVSGENLGERIALQGPEDELKELADTIDGMLARLDGAFASQRHFVANASHELRTPLAIMRTELDVALADPNATARELREMGEAVRETIDRSEGLIAALLALARSEAVTGEEAVDLAELSADCVTDLHQRARGSGVEIRTELQAAVVRGDPALLERLLANLIDNAIRHNVPGGWLMVKTGGDARHVELRVTNSGPEVSSQDAATLTEPFRRLSRAAGGFGLGLSIVGAVVDAHRGVLTIEPREGGGLEVVASFSSPRQPSVAVRGRPRTLTRS